ncbi:MAG: class F sortase [Propionibacteriaceae bacterium]|jgi:hypothetical protein|nr:class F sortase [Propionibacteriaceae bacterium]
MSYQDPAAAPEAQPEEEKKKRRGGILVILLSVLLIAGGVTFGVMSFLPSGTAAGQIRDMEGRIIVPDDPSATSSAFMEEAKMVENDGGEGFVVPVINLNVPVGSVNEVNGVMNPPSFTSVFWIRNRGVSLADAAQGTVYMVTHAIAGGSAPGNFLQTDGHVALNPGDVIMVNDKEYRFESAQSIPKTEIADHAELWTDDPGRLILITCVVRPEGGIAINNLVIIAKLVS